MRDKMPISAYILNIVENDPFLRLQMRVKEDTKTEKIPNITSKFLSHLAVKHNLVEFKVKCLKVFENVEKIHKIKGNREAPRPEI